MDITSDYGSLVRGSNPRGRAIQKSPRSRLNKSFAGFLLFSFGGYAAGTERAVALSFGFKCAVLA